MDPLVRNALGLFTCRHSSEPGRLLMLVEWVMGFLDGELFGRRGQSPGGGTTLFRPQSCAESGNLLQNKALGVMRLVEGFR